MTALITGASPAASVRRRPAGVYDVVRQQDWPAEYNERALRNAFLDTWHGNEAELHASLPETVAAYQNAVAADDFDAAAILVGEGVGRIRDVRPAADIVADMVDEAAQILNRAQYGAQYSGDQSDVRSRRLYH
jgi:nitronate monooxygenase